ncbi:MAG: mevalonate kinase [Anaerolineae bacterium]|nr:mevalonate kinase [Anaerolineae bacterium]
MLPIQTTAPGKIILFGEHAVVYGYPAIAAPVTQVRATARIEPGDGSGARLVLPDLGRMQSLLEAAADDALALAIHLVKEAAGLSELPDFSLTVTSSIPIASGLGSGAAVTAAAVRALALFLNRPDLATNEQVSALTYEVERIHHGTPSGIDNTVVSYEQPIFFVRQQPHNRIEPFPVGRPLYFLIGDTGVASPTKLAVGDVRRQWEAAPDRFNHLFAGCGRLTEAAREAIEQGDLARLGELMQANHALLQEMTVSSPELDRLVAAASAAGALGAKLSGGGRGGNMIALVRDAAASSVRQALIQAGAKQVLATTLPQT